MTDDHRIPRSALLLGLAGLIPFIWSAATHLLPSLAAWAGQWLPPMFLGAYVGLTYGTVILSFMSGVLWGFATKAEGREAAIAYTLSVIPALWVFFMVTDASANSAIYLAAGFVGLLILCPSFSPIPTAPVQRQPRPGRLGVLLIAREGDHRVKERELSGGEPADHQQPHGTDGRDLGARGAGAARDDHRRHRQRLCEERRHQLDPRLEAQRLAHRRRQAGQEHRPLAAAGGRAGPPQVTWRWIKGHAGHAENERADELARAGMAPFKPGPHDAWLLRSTMPRLRLCADRRAGRPAGRSSTSWASSSSPA
jgi:hypothetical protein